MRQAAGGPAAERQAHADAAEVVDQPLQPVGQRPAAGQSRRRLVDLEVAGREIGEVRDGGDHGTVAPEQPGDAGLVAPAPGRHVDRPQSADGGVRRIRGEEIDGVVDELHELRRAFRRQVGMDVEDDPIGVLPAGDLLPDFLQCQISAVLPERPEPHVRRIQAPVRIAQDADLLADLGQPRDEPFGRRARRGRIVDQRQHHRRSLGGGAEEELPQASRVGLQPEATQFRPGEAQLEGLLVIELEDRRRLQRDDADRHRFVERADHQPELFAALDHAEERLRPVVADADGLEPPAQDEAHGGEHDVRLVDDAPGRVVRDPSEPRDFLEGLIGRTPKVLVHLQERNDLIVHGGAFRVRGGYDRRIPPPGLRWRCRSGRRAGGVPCRAGTDPIGRRDRGPDPTGRWR